MNNGGRYLLVGDRIVGDEDEDEGESGWNWMEWWEVRCWFKSWRKEDDLDLLLMNKPEGLCGMGRHLILLTGF